MKNGRGDWIRTSDPLRPRQVRYQAALRPDSIKPLDFTAFRASRTPIATSSGRESSGRVVALSVNHPLRLGHGQQRDPDRSMQARSRRAEHGTRHR